MDSGDATTLKESPKPFCDYTLERQLGEGGFAIVHLGRRNDALKIPRAIKVLRPELAGNAEARGRFNREAVMSLAMLEHPSIIEVHDAGECSGQPFIVFEFVDGWDLGGWIKKYRLPLPIALHVLHIVFGAVEFAHRRQIAHRDLKPANVMLSRLGQVKLGDFGVARPLEPDPELSRTGLIVGTLYYMSPEQSRRETLAGAAAKLSDIFSLGSVAHELLVGKRPFVGRTQEEILEAIKSHRPPRICDRVPGVPGALGDYLDSMLVKSPKDRCQDLGAGILLLEQALASVTRRDQELARYLADPDVVGRELSDIGLSEVPSKPTVHPNRHRGLWIGLSVLALLGALAWPLWRLTHRKKATTGSEPPPEATLHIESTPSGAVITLSGSPVGATPQTLEHLAPGRTPVRLELKGYRTWSDTIELVPKENARTIALEPIPPVARTFRLQTKPAYAAVYLDGAHTPLADFASVKLTEGLHSFHLLNPALNVNCVISFTVHAGDPTGARVLLLDYAAKSASVLAGE
jgi:serine/threonine-protein kinase